MARFLKQLLWFPIVALLALGCAGGLFEVPPEVKAPGFPEADSLQQEIDGQLVEVRGLRSKVAALEQDASQPSRAVNLPARLAVLQQQVTETTGRATKLVQSLPQRLRDLAAGAASNPALLASLQSRASKLEQRGVELGDETRLLAGEIAALPARIAGAKPGKTPVPIAAAPAPSLAVSNQPLQGPGASPPATARVDDAGAPCSGSGAVLVKTDPPGATVFLDGKKATGITPLTLEPVACGRHRLTALLGPREGKLEIRVEPFEVVRTTVPMTAARAPLRIVTTPPEAEVELDGHPIGTSPCIIRDAELGDHDIRATAAGYVPSTRHVTLSQRDGTRIDLALEAGSELTVDTDPPQAWVLLDGAPFEGDGGKHAATVTPGTHLLEVSAPGYRPQELKMKLQLHEQKPLHFTLEPLPASLHVTGTPLGALVEVSGPASFNHGNKLEEILPIEPAMTVPAGSYTVSVAAPGFVPKTETRTLRPQVEETLSFALTQATATATLRLSGDPAGGAVSVRCGEMLGQGSAEGGPQPLPLSDQPLVVAVPSGRCQIEARRSGAQDFVQTLELSAGETRDIKIALLPQASALAGSVSASPAVSSTPAASPTPAVSPSPVALPSSPVTPAPEQAAPSGEPVVEERTGPETSKAWSADLGLATGVMSAIEPGGRLAFSGSFGASWSFLHAELEAWWMAPPFEKADVVANYQVGHLDVSQVGHLDVSTWGGGLSLCGGERLVVGCLVSRGGSMSYQTEGLSKTSEGRFLEWFEGARLQLRFPADTTWALRAAGELMLPLRHLEIGNGDRVIWSLPSVVGALWVGVSVLLW